VTASPFSVLLERPGDFKITSITHQETLLPVTLNLSYVVHPHPSALVAYNNRINQDMDDGKSLDSDVMYLSEFTYVLQGTKSRLYLP
jgi:nucleoporin POM152